MKGWNAYPQPAKEKILINLRLYRYLTRVIAPVLSIYVWIKGIKDPTYRANAQERWGVLEALPTPGAVWVHAASMGEAKASIPLVQEFIRRGEKVFLTTMTPAGRHAFAEVFSTESGIVGQSYIPYDTPEVVRRFLCTLKPMVAVLVEVELWPNLLAELKKKAIPVVLVSARLSHRSLIRYQKLGSLINQSVKQLSLVAAQTEADAMRFVSLGVPVERVQTLGNLKFDQKIDAVKVERGRRLRAGIGIERPVWVAASVREGEEQVVVKAHKRLCESHPFALLILVPRHSTSFAPLSTWLSSQQDLKKDSHHLWSASQSIPTSASILLADVMGELPLFLAAADIAFVGGSLVAVGGHNPLEPAALGMPVLMGPFVRNFQQVDQILAEAGGRLRVSNAEELSAALVSLFDDGDYRHGIGQRAKGAFRAHAGVCQRTVTAIYTSLPNLMSGPGGD